MSSECECDSKSMTKIYKLEFCNEDIHSSRPRFLVDFEMIFLILFSMKDFEMVNSEVCVRNACIVSEILFTTTYI